MKIATCLCRMIRGFHHEIKCHSCCTFPWQHSSDEDYGEESIREDDWRIELRKRTSEEMEEEMQRKYDSAKQIIEEAEFYNRVHEDRVAEENRQIVELLKTGKKKLLTRSQRDQRRKLNRMKKTVDKSYSLDVYDYYLQKSFYDEEQLCGYFTSIMLEGKYNTDRFLATGLSIEEFDLKSYDDKKD